MSDTSAPVLVGREHPLARYASSPHRFALFRELSSESLAFSIAKPCGSKSALSIRPPIRMTLFSDDLSVLLLSMGTRSYYGSRIGLSIGTLALVFFSMESAMRLRGYYIQERIIGDLTELDGRQLPPGQPARSADVIRRSNDDQPNIEAHRLFAEALFHYVVEHDSIGAKTLEPTPADTVRRSGIG